MLFQTVGYVIIHHVWIAKNRHDVKMTIIKELSDSALTIFQRSLHDPTSSMEFENKEEFKLKGEMYDLIRTEIKNDTVWYYAYHDEKETALNTSLSAEVNEKTSHDPVTAQTSMKLLSVGQLQYLTPDFLMHFFPSKTLLFRRLNEPMTTNPISTVSTPPPEIFLFI